MTTAERDRKLGNLIEQKILEFFGDPDAGLELRPSFLRKLRSNIQKNQKLTPHAEVLKRYGIR